jgi:pimeloyl-ACP methyl ester carboxylesterase
MGNEVKKSFLTIQGLRVHYEEHGSGAPLLLIHGLGGPLMWMKVFPLLSEQFRVISLELPGFGRSDCPKYNFTTNDYVNIACEFLQQQHIQGCTVVGISYGGQIAASLAQGFPELVSKLVLICSTGLPPPKWQTKSMTLWKFYVRFFSATLLRSKTLICLFSRLSYYDIRNRPPQLCEQYYEWFKRKKVRSVWLQCVYNIMMPESMFITMLRGLSQPTLILWGRNDQTVSPDYAYKFLHFIPNASVKMFAHCAHSVPLERPNDVFDDIISFLNSPSRQYVKQLQRSLYARETIEH